MSKKRKKHIELDFPKEQIGDKKEILQRPVKDLDELIEILQDIKMQYGNIEEVQSRDCDYFGYDVPLNYIMIKYTSFGKVLEICCDTCDARLN